MQPTPNEKAIETPKQSKRAYARPSLMAFGRLRSLTRSASVAAHAENNPGQSHRFGNFP